MTTTHSFFLPIEPNATQRSRCACRGRFPSVYTDGKYKEWRKKAVDLLRDLSSLEDFRAVARQPVNIDVEVVASRPKTTKLAAPKWDNDNVEKGLWDAITEAGAWWADDKQIISNTTTKRWSNPGEDAGYYVTITFLDGDPFSMN